MSEVSPPQNQNAQDAGASVSPIVFFCKDCDKLVKPIKVTGKYVYKCPDCGTKNVAFGTLKSIQSFYRLNANAPKSMPVEN